MHIYFVKTICLNGIHGLFGMPGGWCAGLKGHQRIDGYNQHQLWPIWWMVICIYIYIRWYLHKNKKHPENINLSANTFFEQREIDKPCVKQSRLAAKKMDPSPTYPNDFLVFTNAFFSNVANRKIDRQTGSKGDEKLALPLAQVKGR